MKPDGLFNLSNVMHDAFAIALNCISLWIVNLHYFNHRPPFPTMQHVLTSSFSIHSVQRADAGEYHCKLSVSNKIIESNPIIIEVEGKKPSTRWHKSLVMHFRHVMFCHIWLNSRPADLHHTAEWREHHEKHFLHTDLWGGRSSEPCDH